MTVPEVAFDYNTGDNITMTVGFGFIEMEEYHAATRVNTKTKEIEGIDELLETEDYDGNNKYDKFS